MRIDLSGGSGSSSIKDANTVNISNGSSSVSVSFATAFDDTNYELVYSVRNLVDSPLIYLNPVLTAKSKTGFTVSFNSPVDTTNYYLDYIASVNV